MKMGDAELFVEALLSQDLQIDSMQHEYDPVKAREYYLKNRMLKGRKKGVTQVPIARTASTKVITKKSNADRLKKVAEARVTALKARLKKLEVALDELTKEAKARSGSDDKTKPESSSKDSKPKTASQKREAAKRSKEYREKNDKDGDPSLAAEAKALEAKIEKVRERIAKMKEQIAKARSKSNGKSK